MHRFRWVVLAALALGCSQSPALTQLIVVVDTDYAIPSELDEIDIAVTGPDGAMHSERQTMAHAADLPYTLNVIPAGGSLGPIRIDATGLHASNFVLMRSARVTLVANTTTYVTLYLVHACDHTRVTCTGSDQTCGDSGTCGPIDRTPLPWTGTAPRLSLDAGPLPDASFDGAVQDAAADASSDAGPFDAGVDGGPGCRVLGCDDHNACTDDICNADGSCAHANNTIGCDDGVFCNGFDNCGGGGCNVHMGSACPANVTCNETSRECVIMCNTTAQCPAPLTGPWGPCMFANPCATNGTQTRTFRSFTCSVLVGCVASDMTQTQSCSRGPTDGLLCATNCGAWSPVCAYVGTCAGGQPQSRMCTDSLCSAGQCVAQPPRMDSQLCPTATPGTNCTDPTTQCGRYSCNTAGQCIGGCGPNRTCCMPPNCAPIGSC
jgi:hypothetical protein